MSKFNPDMMSDAPLRVFVKRFKKSYGVVYVNVQGLAVWGFAKDGDKRIEFDTRWGDKISI